MGVPELVVVLAIAGPIIAAVWIGRMMHRVQTSQEEMKHKLDMIERALHQDRPQ